MKIRFNLVKYISLSLLLCAASLGYATSNNAPTVTKLNPKSLEQMENLKFDSSSASSFSIQPLAIRAPNQLVADTNLVAMWKTPIPYLSVGYTIGNLSVKPNTNDVSFNNSLNNSGLSALAIQVSGF
ncbi:MAG: hypothetical protein K0Q57_832 [Gammaproteobacteria bacterium]|jgi:hypothetical protein|nr:hypothetical protein [Gammaproteobacteria bacterium]